ncbi:MULTISPECIES: hypothetical protein [Pandoraea]|uniref:Uncharacterized protein n=1 Tax=Pandoraea cepalis TaxID=2508294 RepID=A0A5E4YBE1_9BURK|nr:hypothetical protein [Pandoraea cepalis]BET09458.1 hypothetical protein THI4931_05000 [Pandoraea sputorum]VVE46014.1 hypothetical protein PCE31107_04419 [Pandoraea cepalis]
MPTSNHPSQFYPDLSEDRLQALSNLLLDVRYNALAALQSEYDNNYTRECTAFGRQREMLIQIWKAKKFPWLDIKHSGMDVTFTIGGVPCRFFTDDPNNPQKHGFFRRNSVDQLFAPVETQPVLWRFVIERAMTDEDEDHVYLIGFNSYEEKVCEWRHRPASGMLHSVDAITPPSVDLPDAEVTLRPESPDEGAEFDKDTGTGGTK